MMGDPAQEAEQMAQQEMAQERHVAEVGGPQSQLEWLFSRKDIPQKVKQRFWTYSNVKNLRLSNIRNYENIKILIAQLDKDIQYYITEQGDKISYKTLSWLNQLKFTVRMNLLASTGGENRDMRLIQEQRGKWRSKYEQQPMEGEE